MRLRIAGLPGWSVSEGVLEAQVAADFTAEHAMGRLTELHDCPTSVVADKNTLEAPKTSLS